MRKIWIIVANSGFSKIYRVENVNTLLEIKSFENEDAHHKREELVSDKKGRINQRVGLGNDTYEEPTPLRVKQANQFAEKISAFLESGWSSQEFERLYLIAKPPFLGHLRQSLSSHLSKIVESEIHKDLTQMRPEEIREYLPPVL